MNRTCLLIVLPFLIMACSGEQIQTDEVPTHDSFEVESRQVAETRVINVWTPPEYETVNDVYPVLYMPDGGIGEDFPHIANTIADMVESNRIPPLILVGIENTERRRDLTGPSSIPEDEEIAPVTDGASNFRAFIREELFPEVEHRYRTTKERGIIGESAAGLFVVETMLLSPEMFNFYIAIDPSLWWNDHYLVRNADSLLVDFPTEKTRFWFAGSDATDISEYTRELAAYLETESPTGLIWNYSDEPDQHHHTIFRATKEKALVWALNTEGDEG